MGLTALTRRLRITTFQDKPRRKGVRVNRACFSALVIWAVASLSTLPAPVNGVGSGTKPWEPPIERWARAAGGWKQLQKARGAVLRGTRTESGIEGSFEAWVSGRAVRHVMQQPPDRSESVCDGRHAWFKDWNGKALELQGRDATDQLTANWLETVAYGGLSKDAIRDAHPVSAALDSTGTYEIVRFEPSTSVPFSLYLDVATGLPARAERQPYDDNMIVVFEDWRPVGDIRVPYRMREFTDADSAATTTVLENVTVGALVPASRFEPLVDDEPDYRFATGKAALGIPFNFDNDHIMIECSVNGTGPIWFMLDTGAGWTCINETRLADFGLVTFGALSVAGGGNSADLAFTRVEHLEVGEVDMLGQRDGVLDLSGLERLYGMPMGGILGYDFVSRFVIRVDYEKRTIDIWEPSAGTEIGLGEKIPMVLERNHPHVHAVVTVPTLGPIDADFIVDSGAAATANLASPFVKTHRLTELARQAPAGKPNTIPGMETQFFAQTSVRGKLSTLEIGSIFLSEIPVNLQLGKSGFYARASFSGTIGEGILQRFTTTYDYSRRLLVLEPNDHFAKPFEPRRTFGVTFVSDGPEYKTFKVNGVRENSPAEAAGLRKGDIVESLDGKPASELHLNDLRQALSEDGSRHVLEITRGTEPKQRIAITVTKVSIEDD